MSYLLHASKPSDLALFGSLLAFLVLFAGMLLSRNDIRAPAATTARHRKSRDAETLALDASSSPEYLFLRLATRLLEEVALCQSAGALVGAASVAYVTIDTMAFLATPQGDASGPDGIAAWVDAYFPTGHGENERLSGHQISAARRLLLDGPLLKGADGTSYAYVASGPHRIGRHNSVISVARLADDVAKAVDHFAGALHADAILRETMSRRLNAANGINLT